MPGLLYGLGTVLGTTGQTLRLLFRRGAPQHKKFIDDQIIYVLLKSHRFVYNLLDKDAVTKLKNEKIY